MHKDAIDTFSKVININPEFFLAWYGRGICKKKIEDNVGALADYDQSIRKYDPNAISKLTPINFLYSALNNRGNVKSELKDYLGSIEDFNSAIKQLDEDKQRPEVFTNRAITFQKLGKSKFALLDYERALSIDSSFSNAYANRGNLLMNLGFFLKRVKIFKLL